MQLQNGRPTDTTGIDWIKKFVHTIFWTNWESNIRE